MCNMLSAPHVHQIWLMSSSYVSLVFKSVFVTVDELQNISFYRNSISNNGHHNIHNCGYVIGEYIAYITNCKFLDILTIDIIFPNDKCSSVENQTYVMVKSIANYIDQIFGHVLLVRENDCSSNSISCHCCLIKFHGVETLDYCDDFTWVYWVFGEGSTAWFITIPCCKLK